MNFAAIMGFMSRTEQLDQIRLTLRTAGLSKKATSYDTDVMWLLEEVRQILAL